MPKSKKHIDTSKLNQIDAYTYENYDWANIPPIGMAQYDMAASPEAKYEYDPHIDPSPQWAGKKEGLSFTVPTSSIHIHESIEPHKMIRSVQSMGDDYQDLQDWLFESDVERAKCRKDAIEFYQHKDKWTNRLIAGDSLVIMNSLLEWELGMDDEVYGYYITTMAAADDIYCQSTGCNQWDMLDITKIDTPTDIYEWERIPNNQWRQ
jgi:adenine-specific DNA-methyltransferase